MSMLLSMGSCPFCLGGKNTPCFATYENGYHCFTCGKKKSCNKAEYAFRPLPIQQVALKIPNVTCEFSPTVLYWLYKYYVFEDLIKKYGIYYVPRTDFKEESLLFGIYVKGALTFWQQRYFPTKSFSTGGSKDELFVIKHKSNQIVLVEDFISAIRVGEHANVLCLFGVHINSAMSKFIQNLNMNIVIWLDPDDAGREASANLFNRLSNLLQNCSKYRAFAVREPRTISIIETENQPKDYCDSEIKQLLGEINA